MHAGKAVDYATMAYPANAPEMTGLCMQPITLMECLIESITGLTGTPHFPRLGVRAGEDTRVISAGQYT
jgi:hypothetical protein